MKWIRLLFFLLVVLFSAMLFTFVAPLLYAAVFHTLMPLWLLHVRQRLLPGNDVQNGIWHPGTLLTQPFIWMVFGGAGVMYVLASLQNKLLQQRGTFGSAAYARGRHIRAFHARPVPRWLGHGVRAFVQVAAIPARLAFRGVGAVSVQATRTIQQRRGQPAPSLFHIGTYRGRHLTLSEAQQEEHLLITGPTGSKKSTLLMIPNLQQEQGGRSLFIADLKNELHRLTAGAVAQSHQVWWFTPMHPEQSQSYNPLAYVHDAVDANMLADCWVTNTGESKNDPFWSTCARFLICAVILHLRTTEPNAPFERVADYITGKTFADLKQILSQSPSPEARRKAGSFLHHASLNDRLIGSLMTDIGSRFQLFDSEQVRRVTARNEIDFGEMVDVPTALYLSIPRSEVTFYRPLMACFTMQMFRAWEQRSAQEGTLPRGIACYMDEFANIGIIPNFAQFISTARYLRVALIMVIQNFAQLDESFGPQAAETIRANANTHMLLPGAGLRECTYYSERIGDTTVRTWTRSSQG